MRSRSAFTLVELLVAMAIIAILASIMLGASGAAFENARRNRTKSTIAKINGLLLEKYNSYTTRRVDVNPTRISEIDEGLAQGGLTKREHSLAKADFRLLALRELMMLEMPDRWTDVNLNDIGSAPRLQPLYLSANPPLRSIYARKLQSLSGDTDTIEGNDGAECLYMLVMHATGDGEAREQFTEEEIADTDGDGALEFVDGWGNPIRWIRWPAGHVSPLQSVQVDNSTSPPTYFGDPAADHDPFDPFRRDSPNSGSAFEILSNATGAYRLVPLIYSAGPNGDADYVSEMPRTAANYLDPYAVNANGDLQGFTKDGQGENSDEGWIDNITNHQPVN